MRPQGAKTGKSLPRGTSRTQPHRIEDPREYGQSPSDGQPRALDTKRDNADPCANHRSSRVAAGRGYAGMNHRDDQRPNAWSNGPLMHPQTEMPRTSATAAEGGHPGRWKDAQNKRNLDTREHKGNKSKAGIIDRPPESSQGKRNLGR